MKNLDYYMSLNYKMEVQKDEEEGGYTFSYPDLKGCITCAGDLQTGVKLAEDAKRCWFEACLEDSIEIPEPAATEKYSGQFKLRIPKSLHRELVEDAKREGVSMNQLCVYRLSKNPQPPSVQ